MINHQPDEIILYIRLIKFADQYPLAIEINCVSLNAK